MANAAGVSRLHSVARCPRAAHAPAPVQASAGPAQRSSHAPAAPPPLALSTPPHRVLPHRAARPAHNIVLASKGHGQHT
eukprot:3284317-Pleurochrysis_carterae.AAC.1